MKIKIKKQTNNKLTSDMFVHDYIKKAYTVYGKDIMGDSYQTGRMFCSAEDGLKISYRHILQTMLDTTSNSMTKVQAILGDNMKRVHFHGDQGAQEIVYSLANDYGAVECQGNSGARGMIEDTPGSAPRYVEARINPEVRRQLEKLMPYVPSETTITGYQEKRYIPTAIPLGLIAGTGVGMGVGARNKLPAFTSESILKAYLNNDSSKLRINYKYTLGDNVYFKGYEFDNKTNTVINGKDIADSQKHSEYNKEQLKLLWKTGSCKLSIGIPIYDCTISGIKGFIAVCDAAIFKPKITKKLKDWEENGLINMFDYSDEISKMFFARTKGTRKISDEELLKEIEKSCVACDSNTTYEVSIATESITGKVGIGQWIDYTYQKYTGLYETYRKDMLDKLDFMERVWRNFKFVANLLISKSTKDMSDEKIAKACNSDKNQQKLQKGKDRNGKPCIFDCDLEVVKYIGEKPIATLRKDQNIQNRLDKIFEERDYYVNLDIDDEISNFVDCWKIESNKSLVV